MSRQTASQSMYRVIHSRQASIINSDEGEYGWRDMNNGAYKFELDRCCAFSHWLLTYDHDQNMIHRIMDAYDYHKDLMNYHYKQSMGITCGYPQTPYHKTGSSFDDMFKAPPEYKYTRHENHVSEFDRPLMYDEDDDLPF